MVSHMVMIWRPHTLDEDITFWEDLNIGPNPTPPNLFINLTKTGISRNGLKLLAFFQLKFTDVENK